MTHKQAKRKVRNLDNQGTNYFYVYTKKDHIRIESVYGTEPSRVEGLIEAGWSLIGLYSENKIQFMIAGKTTSVLDKGFTCKKEIPQENSCGID